MGSLKSPRTDGFQPLFFKRTWAKTGAALGSFILGTLRGEEISEEAAAALLVLIPKEETPASIRNFRLISLCNVSTKLVIKVISK